MKLISYCLLLILPLAIPQCTQSDSYQCDDSQSYCQVELSSSYSYSLKSCGDASNKYCPTDDSGTQIACLTRTNKLPGIKCTNNDECLETCVNGKCTGIAEGQGSTNNDKCDIGLYSDGSICVKQKVIGESCSGDSQCTNDALCVNKTCTKKWSIKQDGELGKNGCSDANYKHYACESGTCYILRSESSQDYGYCSPVKVSNIEYNICTDSTKDKDCGIIYDNGETIPEDAASSTYGQCQDMHGNDANCYCEEQPGDSNYEKMIEYEKLLLGMDNDVCKQAFDPECWYEATWDAVTTDLYKKWYELYVQVQEGESVLSWDDSPCIPDVFYPYYNLWNAVNTELECSAYICSDDLDTDVCIQFVEEIDTYKVRPCQDDVKTYCDYTKDLTQIGCEQPLDDLEKLPGQSCTSNSECKSNVCSTYSFTCRGVTAGCTEDADCAVGYYCDEVKTQCYTQKTQNEKCDNNEECQNHLICFQDKCAPKFSISTSPFTEYNHTCPDNKIWEICESFTCESTGLDKGACTDPYISVNEPPIPCETHPGNCQAYQYNNKANKIKGTCECGREEGGEAYCSQFSGDWAYILYKSTWQEINSLNSDQGVCHTLLRHNPDCWKQNWPENDYLIARVEQLEIYKYIQNSYSLSVFAEDCVDAIYNYAEDTFNKDFQPLECLGWECEDANHTLKEDHCIQYWDNEAKFYVNPCNESTELPFCQPVQNIDDESACQDSDAAIFKNSPLYPGDRCSTNSECYDVLECKSGKCDGLKENNECKGDEDWSCKVGLACMFDVDKYKCKKQKKIDESCVNDYQCINKALCRNLTCIEAYSAPDYTVFLGDCTGDDRIDTACASSQCQPLTEKSSEFKQCIESYTSRNAVPVACQIAEIDCVASQNVDIYTPCICGQESNKFAFCDLHPGDEPFQLQIQAWKNISDYDQDKCHTKSRFNMWCWESELKEEQFIEGLNYTSTKYFAQYYPTLIQSEDCVQKIYHRQYWETVYYDDGTGDYGALTTLVAALVLALL